MGHAKSRLAQLDDAQQRNPALGIPIATLKKFTEDSSANMAAMMAFWAFFSIFPLLLALITILGYVLPAEDKQAVLSDVAAYLPILEVSTLGGLSGSWLALVVGLASALWSGSAVVRVTQYAFNAVWEVPQVDRPKLVAQVLNSVKVMATVGVGLVLSTAVLGFVSGQNPPVELGVLSRIAGYVLAVALDVGLFVVIFRMLSGPDLSTRDVAPGAVFSGVAFFVLQALSSLIITRYVSGAQSTYGTFATVITLLWWFYLQSQLTLLGAQVNVVLNRRFYPRGLVNAPCTDADHRVLHAYVAAQRQDESVHVDTRISDETDSGATESGPTESGPTESGATESGAESEDAQAR